MSHKSVKTHLPAKTSPDELANCFQEFLSDKIVKLRTHLDSTRDLDKFAYLPEIKETAPSPFELLKKYVKSLWTPRQHHGY